MEPSLERGQGTQSRAYGRSVRKSEYAFPSDSELEIGISFPDRFLFINLPGVDPLEFQTQQMHQLG